MATMVPIYGAEEHSSASLPEIIGTMQLGMLSKCRSSESSRDLSLRVRFKALVVAEGRKC